MDQNKHHHNHGGGNSFLFGFLIGILVTLLFTTKKGREVLRLLMDKGLEKFSNLEEVLDEVEDIDDESEYAPSDDEETGEAKLLAKSSNGVKSSARTRHSLRRFFRKR